MVGSCETIKRHSYSYFVLLIIITTGFLIQSAISDKPSLPEFERLILHAETGSDIPMDLSLINASLSENVTIVLTVSELGFIVVESPLNESNFFFNELSKIPWISSIEPDIIRKPAFNHSTGPDDPVFSDQWALNRTHTRKGWEILSSKSVLSNVTVAIIDTGVDTAHEDLAGRTDPGGIDWITNRSEMHDYDGHGTFLAGIVSAAADNGKGIAGISHATILAERVGTNETGIYSSLSASAIKHAADQGARVILLGYGGRGQSLAEEAAIRYAVEKDSIIVAPAGNEASNEGYYPSDYFDVISVGSTAKTDGLSYFSNYGIFVDLVAPGENIISTWPDNSYRTAAGTSAAAAMVAGAAALILEEDPSLDRVSVRELLTSTAGDLGRNGTDIYYGYGLLDIGAAMKKIRSQWTGKKNLQQNAVMNITSDLSVSSNTTLPDLSENVTVRRKGVMDIQIADIPLNAGWNFISLPAMPGSAKTSGEIFSGINTDGHTIWKYDPVSKDWNAVEKGTNITPLEGFLVYSDAKRSLPYVFDKMVEDYAISVHPGWNLVGSPFRTPVHAGDGMASLSPDWVSLLIFNTSQQTYDPAVIKGASGVHSDSRIIPAFSAFWLYMNKERTLELAG